MRTMIHMEDRLHREAKAYAARNAMTLAQLMEEGLRLRLAGPAEKTGSVPPLPVCREGGGLSPGLSLDHLRDIHDRMDGLS